MKTESSTPPSLDTVFVSLSFTIEKDYIARGVFSALRHGNAIELKGNGSLHFLTQDEAEALLEDAAARKESARGSMLAGYGSHIRNLTSAIEQAKARRAIFAAPAALQTYKSDYSEEWRGTKEQLQAIGFRLAGPWPTEPGGKTRWSKATDGKDHDVHITRHWGYDNWPWLFEARFDYLDSELPPKPIDTQRQKKLSMAKLELEAIPKSAEDFRWECIEDIRRSLSCGIRYRSGQRDGERFHGYTLTDEAVEAILLSLDAVVEAIDEAEVHFDAELHRKCVLRRQHDIAALDSTFQSTLATLAKPNPKILEGRPS